LVKSHFRFALISFLLFLALGHHIAYAQQTLGVKWDTPANDDQAVNQLRQMHEMGISLIEVSSPPSPKVWETINTMNFQVFGDLGIAYPVALTFSDPDSSLIRQIETKASAYLTHPSVQAIGLFKYGAINQPKFLRAIRPFVDQLQKAGPQKIYFTTNRKPSQNVISTNFYIYTVRVTASNLHSITLPEDSTIGGYLFYPSKNISGYISPFKRFIEATPSGSKPIFVDSHWLFSMLKKYPQLKSTIYSLTNNSEAVFPVPKESLPSQENSAIPVIILFAVWGMAALHYNSSPLYRKSLFRYFGAHKFFIDDIFHRQIRSPLPASLVILQNTLLVSASFFAIFSAFWSPTGKDALFYHFPVLEAFGNGPMAIFSGSLTASLALSLVSILWLYLSYRKMNSATQVATIYAWPLHLNFITATISIASFSAGSSSKIIILSSALTVFIFLLSFIFTSIDIARFKASRPIAYLFGTAGLYIILMGGFIVWLTTYRAWWEIVRLSLSLT